MMFLASKFWIFDSNLVWVCVCLFIFALNLAFSTKTDQFIALNQKPSMFILLKFELIKMLSINTFRFIPHPKTVYWPNSKHLTVLCLWFLEMSVIYMHLLQFRLIYYYTTKWMNQWMIRCYRLRCWLVATHKKTPAVI